MIAPERPTHPRLDRPRLRLAVVVVNFNSWPDCSRLASTLAEAPEVLAGRGEVVVVDNASSGPVPADLDPPPRGVRLVARPDNGGFAVGVNAGWRATTAPWLLVLNPDVETDPGLIGRVLARIDAFEADPTGAPGVVGFGLRNPDGTRQPSVGPFPGLARAAWEQFIPRARRKYQAGWRTRPGPVPWVTGACMLVASALLDGLGGMDEDFFLYYEEVALCRAARLAGWRVEYDPSVEVVHLRPLQNRAVSPLLRVITRHSKLLYFRKHLPPWQFATLARVIAAEALVRGSCARALGRSAEVGSWRAIAGVVQGLRRGEAPRGRAVLALAEAATAPPPGRAKGSGPLGPRRRAEALPRKEGTA